MNPAVRPRIFSTVVAAAIVFTMSPFSPTAHANLVFNGGFEEGAQPVNNLGTGGVDSNGNSTAWMTGTISAIGPAGAHWDTGGTTGAGTVISSNAEGSVFSLGAGKGPLEGSLSAAFTAGNQAENWTAYISQAVQGVVAGNFYHIRFALSTQGPFDDQTNPTNYITANWGGSFSNSASPISGGELLSSVGPPPIPGSIPVPTAWTYYDFYNVEALVSNARLSFIGGNDTFATVVDDVSVELMPVPEVSSLGMIMGLGLLALGTGVRVRRRSITAL